MVEYPHAADRAVFYSMINEHGKENVEWTVARRSRWVLAADVEPSWDQSRYVFRLRKPTGRLPQVDLPLAETEALGVGVLYFSPAAHHEKWFLDAYWRGDAVDLLRLRRKLVYLNEEDAVTVAKALHVIANGEG